MIVPQFTFDQEVNGYLSEAITLQGDAIVKMELQSRAPVVTLKQEADGGWTNFGQSPKDSSRYEITIRPTEQVTIKLATPVQVLKCQII